MTPGGERVSPLNIPAWRDFPLRARLHDALGPAGPHRQRRQGAGPRRGVARRGPRRARLHRHGGVDRRRRRDRARRAAARRRRRQRRPHRPRDRGARRPRVRVRRPRLPRGRGVGHRHRRPHRAPAAEAPVDERRRAGRSGRPRGGVGRRACSTCAWPWSPARSRSASATPSSPPPRPSSTAAPGSASPGGRDPPGGPRRRGPARRRRGGGVAGASATRSSARSADRGGTTLRTDGSHLPARGRRLPGEGAGVPRRAPAAGLEGHRRARARGGRGVHAAVARHAPRARLPRVVVAHGVRRRRADRPRAGDPGRGVRQGGRAVGRHQRRLRASRWSATRSSSGAPRSRSATSSRGSSAARTSGARATPSRTPGPTSATSAAGPSSTATSG